MKLRSKIVLAVTSFLASASAFAVATPMGDLINNNVDVSSMSSTATAIAGSAVGIAALIRAARIGKRLISTL